MQGARKKDLPVMLTRRILLTTKWNSRLLAIARSGIACPPCNIPCKPVDLGRNGSCVKEYRRQMEEEGPKASGVRLGRADYKEALGEWIDALDSIAAVKVTAQASVDLDRTLVLNQEQMQSEACRHLNIYVLINVSIWERRLDIHLMNQPTSSVGECE